MIERHERSTRVFEAPIPPIREEIIPDPIILDSTPTKSLIDELKRLEARTRIIQRELDRRVTQQHGNSGSHSTKGTKVRRGLQRCEERSGGEHSDNGSPSAIQHFRHSPGRNHVLFTHHFFPCRFHSIVGLSGPARSTRRTGNYTG